MLIAKRKYTQKIARSLQSATEWTLPVLHFFTSLKLSKFHINFHLTCQRRSGKKIVGRRIFSFQKEWKKREQQAERTLGFGYGFFDEWVSLGDMHAVRHSLCNLTQPNRIAFWRRTRIKPKDESNLHTSEMTGYSRWPVTWALCGNAFLAIDGFEPSKYLPYHYLQCAMPIWTVWRCKTWISSHSFWKQHLLLKQFVWKWGIYKCYMQRISKTVTLKL